MALPAGAGREPIHSGGRSFKLCLRYKVQARNLRLPGLKATGDSIHCPQTRPKTRSGKTLREPLRELGVDSDRRLRNGTETIAHLADMETSTAVMSGLEPLLSIEVFSGNLGAPIFLNRYASALPGFTTHHGV